jgi:glycosyltransferase involved in cell wall biosynthesis
VYKKYNGKCFYVAISEADKSPELDYAAVIHHGIDLGRFTFRPDHGAYLLFFGRIHPEKGAAECIEVARRTGMKLIMAGIIQDQTYSTQRLRPTWMTTASSMWQRRAGKTRRTAGRRIRPAAPHRF